MRVGFVGITGTGKTKLFRDIASLCIFDEEIPELYNQVLDFAGLSNVPSLDYLSEVQRASFDKSRLILQMKREMHSKEYSLSFLADSATPVNLLYMLYFSSLVIEQKNLDRLVYEGIEHSRKMYDVLFYLPFRRLPMACYANKRFSSPFHLEAMDAVLKTILKRLEGFVTVVELPVQSSKFTISTVMKTLAGQGFNRFNESSKISFA